MVEALLRPLFDVKTLQDDELARAFNVPLSAILSVVRANPDRFPSDFMDSHRKGRQTRYRFTALGFIMVSLLIDSPEAENAAVLLVRHFGPGVEKYLEEKYKLRIFGTDIFFSMPSGERGRGGGPQNPPSS